MVAFQWHRETGIADPLWPAAAVLSTGGVAIAYVKPGTGVHLQIFNFQGEKVGADHTLGASIPGAWQVRPDVAELSNGNIIVFASDIVDPKFNYPFQGRFFYSILSADGKIVDSGDIRTNEWLGSSFSYYKAESDGTLSVDFGSTKMSGIGGPGEPVVSADNHDASKDPTWTAANEFGDNIDLAFDASGLAYEVYKVGETGTFMLTRQTGYVDQRPYFGFFDEEDRNALKSANVFTGSPGNDVFKTNGYSPDASQYANHILDGGDGRDTLILDGKPIEGMTASGGIKLMKDGDVLFVSGGYGHLAYGLKNFERIQIEYAGGAPYEKYVGTLALDIEGNAGQAYRIYQAAFDRTPDTAGLSHWIKAMDAGATLDDVAAGFMSSAEFIGLYGVDPSNHEFVDRLYDNVLGREGDSGGIAYWVGQLEAGYSRAHLLAGFAESTENVAGVAPAIADGIWYV